MSRYWIATVCLFGFLVAIPFAIITLPHRIWVMWKGVMELYDDLLTADRAKKYYRDNVVQFRRLK